MKKKMLVLVVILYVCTIGLAVASEYVWPTTNKVITSKFWVPRGDSNHHGTDIGVAYQNCFAVAAGTVEDVIYNHSIYGHHIKLRLDNNKLILYAHLNKVYVDKGQRVSQAEVIAQTGNTGNSKGPHLHVEVREGYPGSYSYKDPEVVFKGAPIPDGKTIPANASAICNKCKGKIGEEYYQTPDGKHYRACVNNHDHQEFIGVHEWDSNNKCKVCKVDKPVVPTTAPTIKPEQSASTAEWNTCNKCGGTIAEKYYQTPDGLVHYRACIRNHDHQAYIGEHQWDSNNNCKICGLPNLNANNNANVVEQEKLYRDLPNDHWAYPEVKAMVEAGIVNGNADGTLGTNEKISTERFIAYLGRVVDKKGIVRSQGDSYLVNEMGVNKGSYDEYIALTRALGNESDKNKLLGEQEIKLVLGNSVEQALENYKKPITREKAASLMGALVSDGTMTSVNVLKATDWDTVNSVFKSKINELAERDIFRGVSNPDGSKTIDPKRELTTVEAIALINRLYNAL